MIYKSIPRATASAEHAELITPVPPMNNTFIVSLPFFDALIFVCIINYSRFLPILQREIDTPGGIEYHGGKLTIDD